MFSIFDKKRKPFFGFAMNPEWEICNFGMADLAASAKAHGARAYILYRGTDRYFAVQLDPEMEKAALVKTMQHILPDTPVEVLQDEIRHIEVDSIMPL